MSRIGKAPIPVPGGVDVTIAGRTVTVKGPNGTLSRDIPGAITVRQDDANLVVERPDDERENRTLHGLTRSLVNNMVVGVTAGFSKELEIVGVGYRAEAQGPGTIRLALGFSHPVIVNAPDGVTFEVPRPPGSWSGASTRRRSVRWRPTSAPSASPSPTRARACATPASGSCARPARPGRSSMGDTALRRREDRIRRHQRVRKKIHGTPERPRLAVFRSNKHLVLQVIDDEAGRTLAAASTHEAAVKADGSTRHGAGRRRGSARSSPSGPRPPASTRSCSIAAGSCTTAGSRRPPTPLAKRDWSSDGHQRRQRAA